MDCVLQPLHERIASRSLGVFAMLLWMASMPLASAAASPAEPMPGAGSREIEIPAWFKTSFLDVGEDVREAARANHRVMVYFGQEGCPYCRKLMEVAFKDPRVVATMQRHFDAIALDIHGSLDVTWVDGATRPEKALAAALGIRYTPTLLFLDEKGDVALRLVGYHPPAKLLAALDSVARGMGAATPLPDGSTGRTRSSDEKTIAQ